MYARSTADEIVFANRLSEALRLGRVEHCDDPKCPNCAPINPN